MGKNNSRSAYRGRKGRRWIIYRAILLIFIVFLAFLSIYFINLNQKNIPARKDLLQLWASNQFEELYQISGEQLLQKPLDYFLLTIHGFSAYQLAIAQINNFSMLTYIDNCIWSLRKALLLKEGREDGRLFYVLGKAYYYKGTGYGDLAVKYLEKSGETGYWEKDIPEYLGMSYINIKDYSSSISAFAGALNNTAGSGSSPSDTLLLSIANSYIALDEDDAAYAYLARCLEVSKDSKIISAARLSLGDILFRRGDLDGAEEQCVRVINETGGSADAHYRLGEIYSRQGEPVRARAEWRRAVQIDPSHASARSRLNL